uniref:ATP synthase subunit a n=1 Tax=Notochthamalus scabrosus TaxID=261896 RepID=U5LSN3_NOTSA|nr:ATP synthase F0 subunit 6 [Notochthamalus scabrosus]AGX31552.1 ATP synthase F0 subunit 6 [Notochthamalus scabrosus]AGX31565.1 ATP synthase F0 subunit 6 [Notochthamalus scabrosus]AGX31604.1 ATP synthase F0 subunit 6 [Notochthamalus scabrosus]AGX31617.1 ATP synthase F0 subunit 6 [Notochthamalus scabrosus]
MMTNLFSSFDPMSSTFSIQLNWISTFLFVIVFYPLYWITCSKSSIIFSELTSYITKEFIPLFKSYKNMILFNVLFMFILINNIFGLMPYTFTSTAHIAMTLSMAFTIWLIFMIYGWVNNTNHMFAHLVPLGTPIVLMPFMVMIETISNIIRPITLSVRLAANLTAGHLLLILLGESMVNSSILIIVTVTMAQFALMTLEAAVAVIQAYVFATLSTLYASEV